MQSPSLIMLSGQQALEHAMDVVANNVANSSTNGFKREAIEFGTMVSSPESGQKLNFVVDKSTYRDASNGPIEMTGNPLDLAIQGQGYFEVRGKDGSTKYTRNGSFQMDSTGQIVTLSGEPVLTDGGQPLTIPDTATEINIGGDGFVTARIDNGANLAELGKLGVVKFANEQAMQSQGNGYYTTSQASAPADNSGVIQGSLEQSNVQSITEMTQMIKIMRSYEQASNLIGQENTRLNTAITTLSKTSA